LLQRAKVNKSVGLGVGQCMCGQNNESVMCVEWFELRRTGVAYSCAETQIS